MLDSAEKDRKGERKRGERAGEFSSTQEREGGGEGGVGCL